MKYYFSLLFFIPILAFTQFGFERSNTIEVYKNNIQQKFPWVGGLDYCNYSNIDLDLDGTLDLFIFDKSGNKALTFIQNGANGQINFEYAPEYEAAFPELFGWTLLVDYDGDGKKDVYTSSAGGASVYRNISTTSGGLEFTLSKIWLPTTYEYNGVVSNTFINVSQGDLPAISDVDNDGDVDILAFYFINNCIRYYKNMSQELYNNSDSLIFKTVNICYGNIVESDTSNTIFLDTCCGNQIDNPEDMIDLRPSYHITDRHAGSSLLSLDLNEDGMQELLIGDIAYNTLTRMMNGSSVPNTDIDLIAPDYAFPSYDTPVNLPIFPAPSHVDVNNDGARDLVVSPNLQINAQNYRGNWMYLNNSIDNAPDFELQTEGFLQNDMIDGGSESFPVYFDYNGDGLQDLFVSYGERYDSISTDNYSQISYYENIGTATDPKFNLETEDFMNLSSFNGLKHLFYRPAFGDADGDGDGDFLLCDFNDTMYYFENIGGAGNMAQFSNPVPFKNSLGLVIDEGIQVSPKFVDLNRDGKQDLVFGKRNGKLAYYRNVGTANTYSFEFVTGSFGGVDVSEFWTIEGIATPEFIDIDNEWHLVCGSVNGSLSYYNQIDGNLSGNFNLVDSALQNIYLGTYSAPAILDINADDRLDMVIGNKRGGLGYFTSASIQFFGLGDYAELEDVSVYPNPAKHQFFIDLSKLEIGSYQKADYLLMDITGKSVARNEISQSKTIVDTKTLSRGVYFLRLNIDGQLISRKIIID